MLDLDKFDLEEIATALADQTDYERRWLIDPRTGKTEFWTAELGIDGQHPVDLDELDLIAVDPLPPSAWYRDMADFARRVGDESAASRLARALQGKGAFRRFRDELHREFPELLPAWRAFQDGRGKRRAVEWLAENSLVDEDAADRYFAEHPDPAVP